LIKEDLKVTSQVYGGEREAPNFITACMYIFGKLGGKETIVVIMIVGGFKINLN